MMTEKQAIRFQELKGALQDLSQDVYDIHWKDLDNKTKDELMVKFHSCLERLEIALTKDDKGQAA